MSQKTVRKWCRRFSSRDTSVQDKPRPGRKRTARSQQNIQAVSNVLGQDRRQTVRDIAAEIGISKSSVHQVLKKDLNLSKLSPKFVPKVLTQAQKDFRVRLCEMNLAALREDDEYIQKFVTGDESWIAVLEVETKAASCEWVQKGRNAPRPVKALRQCAERKSMFMIFFDQTGPILAEFMPQGGTVTADSYCDVLRRLKENLRRKRPDKWRGRNFLLLHDNATPHTTTPTLAFIGESGIDMAPHPPYSLDLAPSDYFLFPRLKSGMRGHCFRNIPDLQTAVFRELKGIGHSEFHDALNTLPLHWMKCVKAGGTYFEGFHVDVDPDEFGLEMYPGTDNEEHESDDSQED